MDRQLPKLNVVGSNPIGRSTLLARPCANSRAPAHFGRGVAHAMPSVALPTIVQRRARTWRVDTATLFWIATYNLEEE